MKEENKNEKVEVVDITEEQFDEAKNIKEAENRQLKEEIEKQSTIEKSSTDILAEENSKLKQQLKEIMESNKQTLIQKMISLGQLTPEMAEKWAQKQNLESLQEFEASAPKLQNQKIPTNEVPEELPSVPKKKKESWKQEFANNRSRWSSNIRAGFKIPDILI